MRRLFLLLLCSLAFGSIGIFRNMLPAVDGATLAFVRVGISLLAFKLLFGKRIREPKGAAVWASYAISGLCIAVAFTLYLDAFSYAKVSDVVLIGFLDPLFVMLVSGIALKERMTKYGVAAIVLAFLGMLALLNTPAEIAEADFGAMLAAAAVLAGGLNTVLTRWEEKRREPLGCVLYYPFAFAAVFLFLPGALNIGTLADGGMWNVGLALVLGAATAAGYLMYDKLMLGWGAHITDLFTRIGITAAGTAMSVLLLGQPISQGWWGAAALLLGSAFLLYKDAVDAGRPHVRRMHAHTH